VLVLELYIGERQTSYILTFPTLMKVNGDIHFPFVPTAVPIW
jgi:hypothetical protein